MRVLRVLALLTMTLGLVSCGSSSPAAPATPAPTATRVINVTGNLAFGNVNIGATPTLNFSITNNGNSPLTVSTINPVGGTGGAAFSLSFTSGAIAAGATQNVTMQFSPTIAQFYSNVLTVVSDATSGNNALNVSGTGIALCQANNTATVAFGNRSAIGGTYDVIFDGAKVVTISPGQDSALFTASAGVAHTVLFRFTNTLQQACAQSAPNFAQCSSQIIVCGG